MACAPLLWQDELLVGHDEIDRQHRALIGAAGELQKAIASNAPVRVVQERCAALLQCARNHFTSEEGLMLASGYPDYSAHRQEHQQLLDQLALIRQNAAASTGGELLLSILSAWTVPHIRFADKKVAVFLAGRA